SQAYVAPISFLAAAIHYEDPFPARGSEEGALGNQYAFRGLAKLQVEIASLARAQVIGLVAVENQIGAETVFAHLRIDLAHFHAETGAIAFARGLKAGRDTVYVVLVDVGRHLIVGQVAHLPHFLARPDALSQLGIEQPQFAIDRAHNVEFLFALAYEHHV